MMILFKRSPGSDYQMWIIAEVPDSTYEIVETESEKIFSTNQTGLTYSHDCQVQAGTPWAIENLKSSQQHTEGIQDTEFWKSSLNSDALFKQQSP